MVLTKKIVVLILLLIGLYLNAANEIVFAMEPPIDEVNIYVKSNGEKGYYLDVLTEENEEYFSSFSGSISKDLKKSNLYKYRDGNWMAHFIRGSALDATMEKSFMGVNTSEKNVKLHCYFDVFIRGAAIKVIFQAPNNNIIISNSVVFDEKKAYIFNTQTKRLETINPYYLMYIKKTFPVMAVLLSVIFALIIKFLSSFVFCISRKSYVIFISTINQVLLYFIIYLLIINKIFDWVSGVFILSILILIAVEYVSYRILLEETISLLKMISFVITSNILILPFGWIFLGIF